MIDSKYRSGVLNSAWVGCQSAGGKGGAIESVASVGSPHAHLPGPTDRKAWDRRRPPDRSSGARGGLGADSGSKHVVSDRVGLAIGPERPEVQARRAAEDEVGDEFGGGRGELQAGALVAGGDDQVLEAGGQADVGPGVDAPRPEAGPGRLDFGLAQDRAEPQGLVEQAAGGLRGRPACRNPRLPRWPRPGSGRRRGGPGSSSRARRCGRAAADRPSGARSAP